MGIHPWAPAPAAAARLPLAPSPTDTHLRARTRPSLFGPRSTADPVPLVVSQQLAAMSPERVRRLEALVELKKLYRNCLRAETLLELPSPIYTLGPLGAPRAL